MPLEFTKRIADQINGTVRLTEVEYELIGTGAFLRLKDVKQLGLAHFVFPGADYSRLSHSIGTCHIAGSMLQSLKDHGEDISDDVMQATRIAALFHDLGHYPFSHATEDALFEWHRARLVRAQDATVPYKHDELGARIVETDVNIREILERYSIDADLVTKIMLGKADPAYLSHIVSSELDADRLDYLRRTAANAGLPYGAPDLDYLVENLDVDEESKRLCVRDQAIGSADHFLLCRYFDYRQIVFQKAVVGFEEVLKSVFHALIEKEALPLSREAVERGIEDGTWNDIDDAFAIRAMRNLRSSGVDEVTAQRLDCILKRRPPKLVWETEYVDERRPERIEDFDRRFSDVRKIVAELSKKFGIPETLWYAWSEARPLTNLASNVPLGEIDDQGKIDDSLAKELPKAVYVLPRGEQKAKRLQDLRQSFMTALADRALYIIRLYVLFPDGDEASRPEIAKAASDALG